MWTQRDTAISQMSRKRLSPGSRPHGDSSMRVAMLDPSMSVSTYQHATWRQTCKGISQAKVPRLEQVARSSRVCSQEQPKHVGTDTQMCLQVILLPGTALPFLECVTQAFLCVHPNMPRGHALALHCDPTDRLRGAVMSGQWHQIQPPPPPVVGCGG